MDKVPTKASKKEEQSMTDQISTAFSEIEKKIEKTIKAFTMVKDDGKWQLVTVTLNEQYDVLDIERSFPDHEKNIMTMISQELQSYLNAL